MGITAPNFPNLFVLYGPNSNLGHNSIIFMIECQVNYVIKLLKMARNNYAWKYIQVKNEIVQEYYEKHVRQALIGKVGFLLKRDAARSFRFMLIILG